jgi:hypothetical protein
MAVMKRSAAETTAQLAQIARILDGDTPEARARARARAARRRERAIERARRAMERVRADMALR